MSTETMSSRERIAAFMNQREVDRVPLLPMHREFSVAQAGYTFMEAMSEPDKYVAAQARAVRDFHFDATFEPFIPWMEEALGATMDAFEDEVPAIGSPFLESVAHLRRLPELDLRTSGRAKTIRYVTRRLRDTIGASVPVFGWVPQPFRAAGQLRGIQNMFVDIVDDPELVRQVQEWYLPKLLDMADVLVEAGADYIFTTNPFASRSCISRDQFARFVHPYSERFMAGLRARGYVVFYHICGDWADRLDLIAAEGPHCLSIDSMDLRQTKERLGGTCSVAGKVLVVESLLQGDPERVRADTRENLRIGAPGYAYAMGGNCVLPRDAPRANMMAMVEETLRLGAYPLCDELLASKPVAASAESGGRSTAAHA